MMKVLLSSIFLISFSCLTFAQEIESENGYYRNGLSKESILHLVSKDNRIQENLFLQNNSQNGVVIQQIGNFNYINTTLKAKEINVSVVQNGYENQLLLDKKANAINQKIVQEGLNNSITDLSFYTKYDINMEIIQKGNNQNVQNYGTNSLSKSMKVIQSGNGASVIILNK
jgi:hypothetical protein